MRVAHFSDCHLSYTAYDRWTGGANKREVDVANAFRAVVDGIIAARPDLILCSGDLFDSPKPGNTAIVFAFRQFKRLREALPAVPIVIAAGNHDTQKKSQTGSIFGLFEELGVEVALMGVRELAYPALDLRVVAVPHAALMAGDSWAPTGPERYRVLVLHGEVEGTYTKFSDRASGTVPVESVTDPEWAYAALGDWHGCKEIGPRAFYAGSTEFVSSNLWGELAEPKSWILADLDTGLIERMPIPLTRRIYDLEPIDAAGMDKDQVNAAIRERLESIPGGIADAIVRLLVLGIPTAVSRQLDHTQIRRWKTDAVHFHLDFRKPEKSASVGTSAIPRFPTLTEHVTDFLSKRNLTPGIEREPLVALGRSIMAEVEDAAVEPDKREVA